MTSHCVKIVILVKKKQKTITAPRNMSAQDEQPGLPRPPPPRPPPRPARPAPAQCSGQTQQGFKCRNFAQAMQSGYTGATINDKGCEDYCALHCKQWMQQFLRVVDAAKATGIVSILLDGRWIDVVNIQFHKKCRDKNIFAVTLLVNAGSIPLSGSVQELMSFLNKFNALQTQVPTWQQQDKKAKAFYQTNCYPDTVLASAGSGKNKQYTKLYADETNLTDWMCGNLHTAYYKTGIMFDFVTREQQEQAVDAENKKKQAAKQLELAADIVKQRKGVGSSRVDLQACKLEYSIVSPK